MKAFCSTLFTAGGVTTALTSEANLSQEDFRKTKTIRRYEIDVKKFPVVVIESDDWGVEQGEKMTETPARLQAVFDVLSKHRGADGQPAVLTAFTCMANPDFDAIRTHAFTAYCDLALDETTEGRKILVQYRNAMNMGIWEPEYHANLHHISPRRWMALLREKSPAGEAARKRFDQKVYAQGYHIPEYLGYNLPEQKAIIEQGFARFKRMFGRFPSSAITSDAYPETVILWAQAGAKTVSLVNARLNCDTVTVYHTKPWNFQDIYARMGDVDPHTDTVYLTRNLFFEKKPMVPECHGVPWELAVSVFERNQNVYKEPSVIQLHRGHICSPDEESSRIRLNELNKLLGELARRKVFFLTSGELGELYRRGWSERKTASGTILRKWSMCKLDRDPGEVLALPSMRKTSLTAQSIGNYLIPEK